MKKHPSAYGPLPSDFTVGDLPLAVRFGGHRATIRFLQLEDVPALLAFFASHTPETIRQRYGHCFREMSPERAARLVGVNQARDAALGVFEDDRLVAVGRYCRDEAGRAAELAFVVHEQRRNLGIAHALLALLAAIAAERGLGLLRAQVERDNVPMLAVFRRAGARFEPIPGTYAVEALIVPPRAPRRIRRPAPAAKRKKSNWLRRAVARLECEAVALTQFPQL